MAGYKRRGRGHQEMRDAGVVVGAGSIESQSLYSFVDVTD